MKKFLDQDGLTTLWEKIKSVFAKKSDLYGKQNVLTAGRDIEIKEIVEVEYLESSGTQLMDTGIVVGETDTILCSAMFLTKSGDNMVFGAFTGGSGGGSLHLEIYSNSAYYARFGSTASVYTAATNPHGRHEYELRKGYLGVDGVHLLSPSFTNMPSSNLKIFGRDTTYKFVGRIYSLSVINENGEAIIDFIPVRVGQVGYMYDRVSGKLFGNNAGTGKFIIGQDVDIHTTIIDFVNDDDFVTRDELSSVATSGSYNDLADKPTIPAVPSNVSAFTNDAGYLVASDIANKVDKVDGKGLSTNDYTTAEKNKLAGIASGATANAGTITGVSLNGTSVATSGVANLKNIPTKIIINSGQKAIDQNGIVDLGTYLTEHQSLTHLAPIASPEFTGTPTAPTPTSMSGATQIATKGYVDTAVAGASGGGSGSGKVYLGKCLTAAGTAAKVGTIDGTFTLEVGCIVGLASTITNTASNPTLNVANTGAYSIWHGNAKLTTSYLYRAQQANYTTFFVFTGEYWHFLSQGADNNTQYSEITQANLNSSTSSSAGLITGRRLQAALDTWKTSQGLATENYVDTAIANAGTVTGVSQADLNTQLPPVGVAGTVKCIYKNTGNVAASIEIVPQNSAAAVEFLSVDGEQVPRTLLDAGVTSRTLNPNETIDVEFVFAPVTGMMPWRNSVIPQGVISSADRVKTLVLPASIVLIENRIGFDANLKDIWCIGPQPPVFTDLAYLGSTVVHAPRFFASIYTGEYVTNDGYPVTIMSY